MAARFTCITCRVAFKEAEIQRQHYKTDWHRYNLKRKVAELPPVSAENFQSLVIAEKKKIQEKEKEIVYHCDVCKKNFNSKNACANHLMSKKHRDAMAGTQDTTHTSDSQTPNELNNSIDSAVLIRKKVEHKKIMENVSDDSEAETVDSDEWEDVEGGGIPINICLFCSHKSANITKKIKHMTVDHSFFIPDVEYIVDMNGLLEYLGEKVGKWHMCLWCNERGRSFYSTEAAQHHMRDKGHCMMLHEGEALAEYSAFYDYSSSYPDQSVNPEEEISIPVLDDSGYQLTLPSGQTIGHRSLFRYYRQHLKPESIVESQKTSRHVMKFYKSLGWIGTEKQTVVRKAKDMQYMHRIQSKYCMQLGVRANKLQKHFRPQVNF